MVAGARERLTESGVSTYSPPHPLTGAANILVVGDWSNYVIFDRIGSTRVELVPHLLGTNGRPTGQRGVYAYFRTGSDVASTGANPGFKLLINS
ncbi:MAG: hypothetical protein ACKO2C_00875 [Actinomycetes bacterium]